MKRRSDYPVIYPDGGVEYVPVNDESALYDQIVTLVGSPFDTVCIGTIDPEGKFPVWACVRDEGLFDGSEPNYPLMASLRLPICGPVWLMGPPSPNGETTPVWDHENIDNIIEHAENIRKGLTLIAAHRQHPFDIHIIESGNVEEFLDTIMGRHSDGQ
jgi:hypothetical protein